jgi:hypothetical protein
VFATGWTAITPEPSRVRRPPPRVADLLNLIRPHPAAPASVRSVLRALFAAGSEDVRRRR